MIISIAEIEKEQEEIFCEFVTALEKQCIEQLVKKWDSNSARILLPLQLNGFKVIQKHIDTVVEEFLHSPSEWNIVSRTPQPWDESWELIFTRATTKVEE